MFSRTSNVVRDDLRVSFEFFPAKNDAMEQTLESTIDKLAPLNPDFVSVTYGAGGSTKEPTKRTLARALE
ncbi:MAG: methylenetetrahydrofolate reductase, partial [Pseudomonadota bacterium]